MTTFKAHTFATDEIVPASVLQQMQDNLDAIAPVGSYLMVHMTPPASGTLVNGAWLGCDGSSVSASTYVKLFNTIGTTYGGGSGSFKLPDFRGRSPFVAASGGSSDASLGKNDGAALASRRLKHSHSVSDTHTHTQSGITAALADAHTHSATPISPGGTGLRGSRTNFGYGTSGNNTGTASIGSHSHSISGTLNSLTTTISAVGVSGLTDGPSFLVCCTVLIRAL